MRKIFHVVLVVVSLGLFVGCQQKTVTDDRYVTHGFPDVTMQGFTYEGNLTFDLNTLCADAVCRPYSSTSADAYADVYVAVGGSGQPMELCAFQRERLLGNRVQWGPVGGEKVMFAGSEYREDVAFYHLGDE